MATEGANQTNSDRELEILKFALCLPTHEVAERLGISAEAARAVLEAGKVVALGSANPVSGNA